MKQIQFHILTLAFAVAHLAHGQVLPTIHVSGNAEIRVAPDLVDITLGIEVIGKALLPAQEEQNRRVAAVIACLKKAGVEDKDIQTDRVSIHPRYDEESSKIKPNRYEVARSVNCTLRDIGKFDEVLTAALQAGATDVSGINFRTTELLKHRDAARLAALRAARQKATLLANELGMKVGRAQSVVEDLPGGTASMRLYDYDPPQISQNSSNRNSIDSISAGMAEGGFAAGQIAISATIYVTFTLE